MTNFNFNFDVVSVSEVFNIILSLLIVFQWFSQYAKEQSIKNSIFALRRMISRIKDMPDNQVIKQQKANDLVDFLDSLLATIGFRHPFKKRLEINLNAIKDRMNEESDQELEVIDT